MRHSVELLELAEQAHVAAAAPKKWSAFLGAVSQRLRCEHILLFLGPVQYGNLEATGLDAGDLARFTAQESIQLGKRAYYDKVPNGQAVSSASFISDSEMERSTFYNEVIRPVKGFRGASLASRGETQFLLSACRRRGDDPFGQKEIEFLQNLHPHLCSAMEIARRLHAADAMAQGVSRLLNHIQDGLILLDELGSPVFVNQRAAAILSQQDGLSLRPSGLTAHSASCDRLLRQHVLAACSPGAELKQLRITRPSQRPPLVVRIVPVGVPGFSLLGTANARVALFLDEPDPCPAVDRTALRDVFQLTERECDVATLLTEGASLSVAAERLGISRWTVRYYLKLIFEKTGTNSQVALVARLRGFLG
jgi:DNA-binding CsgD family transcriptional regulator/PAS domain-containing protein